MTSVMDPYSFLFFFSFFAFTGLRFLFAALFSLLSPDEAWPMGVSPFGLSLYRMEYCVEQRAR